MTTGQPTNSPLSFDIDKTQYGIRVKCPKLALGPLEIGIAATYTVADAEDDTVSLFRLDRFNPSVTVKDIFFRGKLEIEPQSRKAQYSKKFRLPFLNTELLKVQLSAQLPQGHTDGGLLGRALGVTVSLSSDRLFNKTVVRKAPDYALQVVPRIGPPQSLYDKIGFPGSVYLKANTTVQLSDAASVDGMRAHVDVHKVNIVMRLYDVHRVKPARLGRNLLHVARRLTLEEIDAVEETRQVQAAVKVARLLETSQPEPDIIDRGAAIARKWAHAMLVNSCVATRHLQEQAALAADYVRASMTGPKPAATAASN